MARAKNSTNLTDFLLKCMVKPNPMLSMPEWLCTQLMEAELPGWSERKRMRILCIDHIKRRDSAQTVR